MDTDTETTPNTPTTPEVPKPHDASSSGSSKSDSDKGSSDNSDMTPEEKRDALRAKIEASERRIAERTFSDQAKDAAITARDYTKENPLTVLGGALVVGLLIGLLTRPGRRIARDAAVGTAGLFGTAAAETRHAGRVSKHKASRLGDIVTDAFAVYGAKLMDGAVGGARAGQDALEDLGDSAAATARSLRRDADFYAGSTKDSARHLSRRTRRHAGRTVRDIKGR